jgi:peptidoglycan/LPS O-acetylase OafA/YrhL
MGVWAFKICSTQRIGARLGGALVVVALAAWIVWEVVSHRYHLRQISLTHWLYRDRLPQDYIISSLFAVHLMGFAAISHLAAPALERFARPIRWLAGATYTIYLFHMPVAQFLTTVVPWPLGAWQTSLVMLPGVLLLLFGIAAVTERRKNAWRTAFASLFEIAGGRASHQS